MIVSELPEPRRKRGWTWLLGIALGGAVAGYAVGFLFADQIDRIVGGSSADPSRGVALAVALVYAVSALVVLAGVIAPRAGAHFLNVEDAVELMEQRRQLALSAWAMLAIALLLGLLAFAAPAGPLAAEVVLAGCLVSLGALILLSQRVARLADEFTQALSRDAAVWGFYLLSGAGGLWAIAGHLGFLRGPVALDWVTGGAAALLLGAMIAVGRRGLLTPR